MKTRAVACSLCCVLLLSVMLVGSEGSPAEIGPYTFETFEADLQDEDRDRSMGLLVFLPEREGEPSASPLVVFNHGFLLSSLGYLSYGRHLASHGFVVAMPSFPTSFLRVHHVRLAEDVRFVIDSLLEATADEAHPLFGRIDPERIGGAGHSLGGKLSLFEAVTDDRVRAIAVLDPVDEGNPIWNNPKLYPSVAPELMPELEIPLMFIGAELGKVLVTFSPCAPEDENYERFFEAANAPAIEITLLDVGHGQFVDEEAADADDPCARGDVPSEWVRSTSVAYLTAFFLGHLAESPEALVWLDERLAQDVADGRILVREK